MNSLGKALESLTRRDEQLQGSSAIEPLSPATVRQNERAVSVLDICPEFQLQTTSYISLQLPAKALLERVSLPDFLSIPITEHTSKEWINYFTSRWHTGAEACFGDGLLIIPVPRNAKELLEGMLAAGEKLTPPTLSELFFASEYTHLDGAVVWSAHGREQFELVTSQGTVTVNQVQYEVKHGRLVASTKPSEDCVYCLARRAGDGFTLLTVGEQFCFPFRNVELYTQGVVSVRVGDQTSGADIRFFDSVHNEIVLPVSPSAVQCEFDYFAQMFLKPGTSQPSGVLFVTPDPVRSKSNEAGAVFWSVAARCLVPAPSAAVFEGLEPSSIRVWASGMSIGAERFVDRGSGQTVASA